MEANVLESGQSEKREGNGRTDIRKMLRGRQLDGTVTDFDLTTREVV
jgi:hypothetical protein